MSKLGLAARSPCSLLAARPDAAPADADVTPRHPRRRRRRAARRTPARWSPSTTPAATTPASRFWVAAATATGAGVYDRPRRPHRVRRAGRAAAKRVQGSGTTPLGTVRLISSFGRHARGDGWDLPYRQHPAGRLLGRGQPLGLLQPLPQQGARAASAGGSRRAGWTAPSGCATSRSPYEFSVVTSYNYAAQVRHRGAGHLPARQRPRCDRRLRERAAVVPKAMMWRLDPAPGAGHGGRQMSADEPERGGDPGRGRGPHAQAVQPRQGPLPAHRHHQGRGAQLLRPGRAGAAAAARRTAR